jgi:hypothetical protein
VAYGRETNPPENHREVVFAAEELKRVYVVGRGGVKNPPTKQLKIQQHD